MPLDILSAAFNQVRLLNSAYNPSLSVQVGYITTIQVKQPLHTPGIRITQGHFAEYSIGHPFPIHSDEYGFVTQQCIRILIIIEL